MKRSLILASLLTFNILNAESGFGGTEWKEKEMLASDIKAPAELLLELDKENTNPFIKKALGNNPKYKKMKENDVLIKLLESRKMFESNIDNIKNKFDLVNANLKRILYVYKTNLEKEQMVKKELNKRFGSMKNGFEQKYKKELERVNSIYNVEIKNIKSKINSINIELKKKEQQFKEQLIKYVELERKKMLFKTDSINKESEAIKKQILDIRNYLTNIEKKIFNAIQRPEYKELKDTVNPELLSIKNLYDTRINDIELNLNKIFTKKNKLLFLLETNTIKKAETERYMRTLNVNRELSIAKIKQEAQLKKDIVDAKMRKELASLEAQYTKNMNTKKIEANQLNMKINEVLSIYDQMSKENKVMARQLNDFNRLVNTLKEAKELVLRKDYQAQKSARSFKTTIERKISIAANKSTLIPTLIQYSRNLDWRVREAVARNINTPMNVLENLTVDENLFVKLAAKETIEFLGKREEAKKILEKEDMTNKF